MTGGARKTSESEYLDWKNYTIILKVDRGLLVGVFWADFLPSPPSRTIAPSLKSVWNSCPQLGQRMSIPPISEGIRSG